MVHQVLGDGAELNYGYIDIYTHGYIISVCVVYTILYVYINVYIGRKQNHGVMALLDCKNSVLCLLAADHISKCVLCIRCQTVKQMFSRGGGNIQCHVGF